MTNEIIGNNETKIRRLRGLEIAKSRRIRKGVNCWFVPSQMKAGHYVVKPEEPSCTCPDFQTRHEPCKHLFAVQYTVRKLVDEDGNMLTLHEVKTYPQNWSAYDTAQGQEKELFMKLLNDLCQSIEQPQYSFGRPTLQLADMIFASALKVFTTFSLRRFKCDMQIAKEKNYVGKLPCFASVGHFMQKAELTPILLGLIEKSALPLKEIETCFAIDSSGFSSSRFARWYSFKYGKESNYRVWLKAHLVCGTKTNIVTTVKIKEGNTSDSKELPDLISLTSRNFNIQEVVGDKAYSSRTNLQVVADIGATPFIPFSKATRGNKKGCLIWSQMYHYFAYNKEDFLQHYHKRSNVETTFHMIKAKFGSHVRSKAPTAQVNEVLLKILCHNICVVIQGIHELGVNPDFVAHKSFNAHN